MKKPKVQQLKLKRILWYYWRQLRRYSREQIVLLVAVSVLVTITVTASPLLGRYIVDTGVGGGPDAFGDMIHALQWLCFFLLLHVVAFSVANWLLVTTQSKTLKHLHDAAHKSLIEKSHEFFVNTFAGSLIAKTSRYNNAFITLHDLSVFQVWWNGLQLLIAGVVLSYYSWWLGLAVAAWVIVYVSMTVFLVKRQIPKSLKSAELDSVTTAHYSDNISNALTIKMFARSREEQESFERTTGAQEHVRRQAWLQQHFWNNIFQSVAVVVFEILLLGTVIHLWNAGVVTIGTILLAQVYVILILNTVMQLGRSMIRAFTAVSDANQMVELMDETIEVDDVTSPESARFPEGRVHFKDVSYRYNGGSGRVFENLDLEIPAGQRVALVGHSGAGKTTIVKLLLRFVDVEKGEILIDGQNIAHVAQEDLRKHIAYVPQEPLLFHRTLFENIAYGKEDATREEVEEVAKRARAHDFIAALPHGYDTLVGERGIKLSGGERQRVAIARALIKDAPIVILDEATSSLDSVSEQHIQLAFDELMKGRTTIVIAHRLSTIKHMDRIVVLDKGKVIEDGTHDELLKKSGIYAELWSHQVGGFIGE